jgi:hypothetical protein
MFSLTWRPAAKETLPVSCVAPRAPTLLPGQALKVMTWNVQYLAGKNYVFWNDTADAAARTSARPWKTWPPASTKWRG